MVVTDSSVPAQTFTFGYTGTSQTLTQTGITSGDCSSGDHGITCNVFYALSSASGTTAVTVTDTGGTGNNIQLTCLEYSYTYSSISLLTAPSYNVTDGSPTTWTTPTITAGTLTFATTNQASVGGVVTTTTSPFTQRAAGQTSFGPYTSVSDNQTGVTSATGTITGGSPSYIVTGIFSFSGTGGSPSGAGIGGKAGLGGKAGIG